MRTSRGIFTSDPRRRSSSPRITSRSSPGRAGPAPARSSRSARSGRPPGQQQRRAEMPGRKNPASTSDQGAEERRRRADPGQAGRPAVLRRLHASRHSSDRRSRVALRHGDGSCWSLTGSSSPRTRPTGSPSGPTPRSPPSPHGPATVRPAHPRARRARPHWCLVTEWESVGSLPAGARRLRRQGARHPAARPVAGRAVGVRDAGQRRARRRGDLVQRPGQRPGSTGTLALTVTVRLAP